MALTYASADEARAYILYFEMTISEHSRNATLKFEYIIYHMSIRRCYKWQVSVRELSDLRKWDTQMDLFLIRYGESTAYTAQSPSTSKLITAFNGIEQAYLKQATIPATDQHDILQVFFALVSCKSIDNAEKSIYHHLRGTEIFLCPLLVHCNRLGEQSSLAPFLWNKACPPLWEVKLQVTVVAVVEPLGRYLFSAACQRGTRLYTQQHGQWNPQPPAGFIHCISCWDIRSSNEHISLKKGEVSQWCFIPFN
jgi:hypothetical protein